MFKIYSHIINTVPKFTFGQIKDSTSNNGIKLSVDLINKADSIVIDILTNKKTPVDVYSKSDGMSFVEAKDPATIKSWLPLTISFIASIFTVLATIVLARKKKLTIISASYGKNDKYLDITSNLNDSITDNRLTVRVDNKLSGIDPLAGMVKELKVKYSFGNKIGETTVNEGEYLILPPLVQSTVINTVSSTLTKDLNERMRQED